MGAPPQSTVEMVLTIYSYPGNPRVQKVLIAAKYNAVHIENPEFDMSTTKTAEFRAKNPIGKVPVLETDRGYIFESGAILRYVARLSPSTGLYGNSFYEQGLVDQWIDFASTEIDNVVAPWVYPVLYKSFPSSPETTAQAKTSVKRSLEALNTYLEHHTYLAGERISAADIAVVGSLLQPVQLVMDDEFRAPYVNVWRWFFTCVNQPNFKAVLGNVVPVSVSY
eukprot:c25262_g1_i1.p2 GENE.c25262_g1_i1~~c25262_g1_i1.p2  ORF type:complete len:223 (+),score=54.19 c25262_g1_i1:1-669(+)